jgi:hypothetical protein
MAAASRETGIAYATVKAKERGLRNNSGDEYKRMLALESGAPGSEDRLVPFSGDELCGEARRALEDFGFFRYRYFGRRSTPWQEEAGHQVVAWLATKQKEYAVVNCPPGSGKTTLFTHDIPAWLTCRNRGIRGALGHASQQIAEAYLRQLKLTLENPVPMRAEPDEFELGLAVDAEATLVGDYGLFKPKPSVLWSNQQIIVAQVDGRSLTHKEPTWSAFGLETTYIGVRLDISLWDDPEDEKGLRTLESIDIRRARWDKVAEKRLEPGGTLILPTQRLAPEDLSRHCLNKPAGESFAHDHECCDAEPGRKYHHIRYRAHYPDRCVEVHDEDQAEPYPKGCLLDPRRLPWSELEAEMASDETNFATVYQQEDADPRRLLVPKVWISGGTDPVTGDVCPGCWDADRGEWELPENLAGPRLWYATADPSPTKFWAIEAWCYTPESEFRYLLALERRSMEAPDFLDWNHANGCWTGLMEEWHQISKDRGGPISVWVVEQNAAQRFMLQYEHVKRWMAARGVRIIGHETHRNKADPKMGVTSLAPHYRFGRKRLPGKQMDPGRPAAMKLVDEVTKWPLGRYDDCVMADWMGEWNLPQIWQPQRPRAVQRRPSWMARRQLTKA